MTAYICEFLKEEDDIQTLHVISELVRCADCEYSEEDHTHMFCSEHYHKVYEDDYCSSGKKRKQDTLEMLDVFLDKNGLKDPTGLVDAVRRKER